MFDVLFRVRFKIQFFGNILFASKVKLIDFETEKLSSCIRLFDLLSRVRFKIIFLAIFLIALYHEIEKFSFYIRVCHYLCIFSAESKTYFGCMSASLIVIFLSLLFGHPCGEKQVGLRGFSGLFYLKYAFCIAILWFHVATHWNLECWPVFVWIQNADKNHWKPLGKHENQRKTTEKPKKTSYDKKRW